VGMEENLFPHKMSIGEPGRLEEERRLCYVGITRAMEKLHICYAENRRMYGSETFNAVSRFVKEIPQDLIEEVRIKATISRPVSYGRQNPRSYNQTHSYGQSSSYRKTGLSDSGVNTGLSLGQRVTHPMFGEGVVLHFEGQGGGARVQVNFDNEGSKWLVLQYAKLEAL